MPGLSVSLSPSATSLPAIHSCLNHVCCQCFSLAYKSLRRGFVAITIPFALPAKTDGWQGLPGVIADMAPGDFKAETVEKNRRIGRSRTKSVSSVVRNDRKKAE